MMHIKNLVTTIPIPGSDGWHTAVIEVTSETADDLLAKNDGNRRLSPGAMARYAAAMRKGDWQTSPEPLIFAPSGRLMNGQTRLHAIKATGIPQKFMCVFGVDEKVFSVLDRGRPRTLADAHNLPREAAEAARVLTLATFPKTHGSHVADSDFLAVARVIETTHAELIRFCGARARYFSTAPFRAAAVLRVVSGEDCDFVFGLYRNLVLGHVSDLPPVGEAAARAVLTGRWGTSKDGGAVAQGMALARAWSLFQADGTQRTRVPISDPSYQIKDIGAAVWQALQDAANV
jgi:hypothetical protein